MGTAGKAIAFSGLTVLVSLSTVLLVPSPAFRSMALGIMLSVVAVLAATLTLLPAVLGRLGTRIDAGRLRLPGALDRAEARAERRRAVADTAAATTPAEPRTTGSPHPHLHHTVAGLERALHHWGGLLHRRPWVAGGLVLVVLGLLAWPVTVTAHRRCRASRSSRPSRPHAPATTQVVDAFGPGAPGTLSVLTPRPHRRRGPSQC